jgi:AraC-like DNA-binding protein
MSSSPRAPRIPLFVLQIPQKTLSRFGLNASAWEELIEFMLDIRIRDVSLINTFIDFTAYRDILQLTMNIFGRDKMLRWYVEDIRPHHLGPMGVAMGAAPTVGDSIELWFGSPHVLMPTLLVNRRTTEQELAFTFRQSVDMDLVGDHYMEIVLLTTAKFINEVGNGRVDMKVSFSHAAAFPAEFYLESFGLVPHFSAPENSLRISRDALSLRNDEHIPLLYQQALEGARRLIENARNHDSLSHKVRQLLIDGSARNSFHSLEELANHLHLSVRTLTRRLHEENASFRELQREARLELAKQQLRHSRLPIKTICANSGFTNISAFSRAFRNYTHQSPSEYREGDVGRDEASQASGDLVMPESPATPR